MEPAVLNQKNGQSMLLLTSSFDSSTVESRVSSFPETRRTFDALYLHSCNSGHFVLRTIIHKRSEQKRNGCRSLTLSSVAMCAFMMTIRF